MELAVTLFWQIPGSAFADVNFWNMEKDGKINKKIAVYLFHFDFKK